MVLREVILAAAVALWYYRRRRSLELELAEAEERRRRLDLGIDADGWVCGGQYVPRDEAVARKAIGGVSVPVAPTPNGRGRHERLAGGGRFASSSPSPAGAQQLRLRRGPAAAAAPLLLPATSAAPSRPPATPNVPYRLPRQNRSQGGERGKGGESQGRVGVPSSSRKRKSGDGTAGLDAAAAAAAAPTTELDRLLKRAREGLDLAATAAMTMYEAGKRKYNEADSTSKRQRRRTGEDSAGEGAASGASSRVGGHQLAGGRGSSKRPAPAGGEKSQSSGTGGEVGRRKICISPSSSTRAAIPKQARSTARRISFGTTGNVVPERRFYDKAAPASRVGEVGGIVKRSVSPSSIAVAPPPSVQRQDEEREHRLRLSAAANTPLSVRVGKRRAATGSPGTVAGAHPRQRQKRGGRIALRTTGQPYRRGGVVGASMEPAGAAILGGIVVSSARAIGRDRLIEERILRDLNTRPTPKKKEKKMEHPKDTGPVNPSFAFGGVVSTNAEGQRVNNVNASPAVSTPGTSGAKPPSFQFGTTEPGKSSSNADVSSAAVSGFTFGAAAQAKDENKSSTTSFSFGGASTSAQDQATGNGTSTDVKPIATAGFSFETPTTPALGTADAKGEIRSAAALSSGNVSTPAAPGPAPAPAEAFTFVGGGATPAPAPAAGGSFKFGSAPEATPAPAVAPAAAGGFSFGGAPTPAQTTAAASSTPSVSFAFGANAAAPATPAGTQASFSFGAPSARTTGQATPAAANPAGTPSFAFGASAAGSTPGAASSFSFSAGGSSAAPAFGGTPVAQAGGFSTGGGASARRRAKARSGGRRKA